MQLNQVVEKLFYKLIRVNVANIGTDERVYKWIARIVYQGRATIPLMEEDIVGSTTVTRPDVHAVLTAFGEVVWKRLRAGQIVELPPIGNFRLVIHNKGGAATKESWIPALIKKVKINFLPTGGMRDINADLSFEHWAGDKDEATTKAAHAVRTMQRHVGQIEQELDFTCLTIQNYRRKLDEGTAKPFMAQQIIEMESHIKTLQIELADAQNALAHEQEDYKALVKLHAKYTGITDNLNTNEQAAQEQDLLHLTHNP